MKFRNLMPHEIELRAAMIRQNGLQLLIYKTARTDSTILDETVGSENWQCKFYDVGGVMFCSIGIRIKRDNGSFEWVWKDDAGSEGNIEKEKSLASSCFKRAGFKWSIGKELYTSPFIWIPADRCNIQSKNGKYICNDRFRVSNIKIENGTITFLEIVNVTKNIIAFRWGSK